LPGLVIDGRHFWGDSPVSLEIISVWKNITPELEAELKQFWISNNAIADEKLAAERAKQVVCLVRSEQGEIVGATTVYPRIVPRLRQPMYYYRNFIVADHRGKQLAAQFLHKTKEVLQDFNLALPKPNCLGIIIELENESLAAHRNEAQWNEGFTFIGYSPKGLHLRIWYFAGVRLFPPAPLKKPARQRATN
jgi:hypothetical protein